MAEEGFGTGFCRARGWNHVYVAKRPDSRFRSLAPERLAQLLRPIIEGREVYTYGSSAGGYAALYYGGVLNARILAVSPRNTQHPLYRIPPGMREAARRLREGFYHHLTLAEMPLSVHRPTILVDPRQRLDMKMLNEWVLPAYPQARITHVRNGGHEVLLRLSAAGVLQPVIEGFFRDDQLTIPAPLFPEGTPQRAMDDAIALIEAGRLAEAALLMTRHGKAVRDQGLWQDYMLAVWSGGNRAIRRAWRDHHRQGYGAGARPVWRERLRRLVLRYWP